jgi:molybdopterin converting factor small subunit
MSVKLLNPLFYKHTGGRREIEVEGRTVSECLGQLAGKYPSMKKNLFSDNGALLPHLLVSLNMEVVQHEDLDHAVKDGDQLHVMTMVEGG